VPNASPLSNRRELEAVTRKASSIQYLRVAAEDNIKGTADDESRNTLPARLDFEAETR
jgi:hypothetical protein